MNSRWLTIPERIIDVMPISNLRTSLGNRTTRQSSPFIVLHAQLSSLHIKLHIHPSCIEPTFRGGRLAYTVVVNSTVQQPFFKDAARAAEGAIQASSRSTRAPPPACGLPTTNTTRQNREQGGEGARRVVVNARGQAATTNQPPLTHVGLVATGLNAYSDTV